MKIRLSYSGHGPSKIVECTEEEFLEIKKLTEGRYLFDTPEGQGLLCKLEDRPRIAENIPTVIAYC